MEMRKLSLVILSLLAIIFLSATRMSDSPHGTNFTLSCDLCHNSNSWKLDKAIYAFDHNKTAFPLNGQHQAVNCRSCHPTLVFSEAKTACVDCHADMHYQTVGPDCVRCHTTKSWIVENITDIHQRSRFPLLGAHKFADCSACHKSASLLRFEPLGVQCYDCHEANYLATTNPNHVLGGFSKDCIQCHSINSITWVSTNVDHSFFPLTLGHSNLDCSRCHTNGSFSGLTKDCFACHLPNYNASTNPPHQAANIPTTCADCHTTIPGWKPATFAIHNTYWALTGAHITTSCNQCHNGNYTTTPNTCVGCHQTDYNNTNNPPHATTQFGTDCQTCHTTTAWIPATFDHDSKYFPIYSGKHQGTWTLCTDCHTNASNYATFSCIDCHAHSNQADVDSHHQGVGGYTYSSIACYSCHPTGSTGGAFNHNNGFPLTGAHATLLCSACHATGFSGTPTACNACHINAYNGTNNPNHATAGISTDCVSCHTTNPGWTPATMPTHNNYWQLTGAHITATCNQCHNGNYNTTPNTCVGCHINDYNNSTNPPHASAQFPTDCQTCHTTTAWSPSTFNHDGQYFPIYSGHHAGKWTLCADCHTNASNYQVFSCIDCHAHSNQTQVNNDHQGVSGYSYNSVACYNCHPTGSSGGKSIIQPRIINNNKQN
jgi:hypothetical protein